MKFLPTSIPQIFAAAFCLMSLNTPSQAQTSVSKTIGNPDSSNLLMIQQTMDIEDTPQIFSSSQQSSESDWETLPQDPGVEVAPEPFQTPQESSLPTPNENIEINDTIIDD